jgi:WhiB family transcriptional regulator, redox-sensing transcriptional regulator
MASVESAPDITIHSLPAFADWRDDARCKGQLRLFYPPKAERPQARARREAKAKQLCDACSVIDQCRSWARENREYGYWAGESEEDRHLLGFHVSAPIGVRTRRSRHDELESA